MAKLDDEARAYVNAGTHEYLKKDHCDVCNQWFHTAGFSGHLNSATHNAKAQQKRRMYIIHLQALTTRAEKREDRITCDQGPELSGGAEDDEEQAQLRAYINGTCRACIAALNLRPELHNLEPHEEFVEQSAARFEETYHDAVDIVRGLLARRS